METRLHEKEFHSIKKKLSKELEATEKPETLQVKKRSIKIISHGRSNAKTITYHGRCYNL